jgi:predicted amidophosphoribosyltransferase
MDRCPNCGNPQLTNGNYCERCGTELHEDGSYSYDPSRVNEAHENYKDEIEDDYFNYLDERY